ncbi:large proline-rich protein bag6-A isoform X2 [Rhynchophorus ferrugineus]|uniref:large proline-rich protein bag6-A isoform X2 n=1 Tax=Rhynchophorus ferrugineus TaxID=354439 RepID=UPI003FCDB399
MISVTVKTLDSQNHQFSVEDDITVEQFKRHIEVAVNVAADRQRIIYCGRVLQDSSKLKDYDVDGKVVHLVQRAPPTSGSRSARSITPPPDLNRARGGFRGFERVGNAVYMPMPFPQGFMDPQQMIPPRATHTLSVSRLNVARRMLRQAEAVIRLLENPSSSDQPSSEEQPQEEMTPVIEASGDRSVVDEAIVNAVENSLFGSTRNAESTTSVAGSSSQSTDTQNNGQPSDTRSTPENSTPRSGSSENVGGENQETGANTNSSRRTRGPEMAELLTTLNQLQARFAPFLARYQAFMQDDPQVSAEDLEQTRGLINRVSQILHFLGHAYHSLSDIMINVDLAPPRLLYCRPILIQHSAVVQAGIPIQVEAQINVSADRPGTTSTTTSSSSTASSQQAASSSTATSTTTSSSTGGSNTNASSTVGSGGQTTGASGITLQPGFVGLPFMPTGSMRVITTPLEFRTLHARAGNLNNPPRPTPPPRTEGQTTASAPPSAENGQPRTGPVPPNPGNPFAANNGNLEFFMEVTPEGITIDSLESLAGSNQAANEFLRSGNLIQSLMQLVGSHLGGGLGHATQQQQQQAQSQTAPSTTDASQTNGTQNSQSQARGNTQTNPTTATHTRSTPRPHVHMTQQAVQGGFDPFLPCYSHHVSHSRGQRIIPMSQPNRSESTPTRDTSSAQTSSTSTQTNQQTQRTNNIPPNLGSFLAQFEDISRSIPAQLPPMMPDNQNTIQMFADNLSELFNQQMAQGQQQPPPQRGAPDGQRPPRQLPQDTEALLNNFMNQAVPQLMRNGPTLDQYIQTLYPNSYLQGESVVIDLILSLLGNLRFNDFLLLARGNMTPLNRQADSVQRFVLNDICQNDITDSGIQRATDRVINDCRPIITALESVPPRDGIDMTRTINNFFRQRMSAFIQLVVNPQSEDQRNSSRTDLVTTLWTAAKELLALAIHCSANGQQGVEAACEELMSNVPAGALDFVAPTRRLALRALINNLDTRSMEVQQYVVKKTPESTSSEPTVEPRAVESNEVEAMEVDYATSPTNQEQMVDTSIKVEETEPLPNVIWGSEPWHRQTPEEWVPIITRDMQKQRRQNSQPPFSDAYLSGMPSKRRKLVNKSKPQGSLPQVISDSVREAVTATGLTSAAPLDVVTEAAGQSIDIQTAYRTLLRQTVQANLRDNEDFTPERFPNTSKYFNGPPPE